MSIGTAESLGVEDNVFVEILAPYKTEKARPFWFLGFPVYHDAREPMGFLISTPSDKKILFATDTCYLSERFTGITHLMIECNYDPATMDKNEADGLLNPSLKTRIIETHFGLENVVRMLKSNNWDVLEEIHLIHMSDANANAELIEREIRRIAGVPVYLV
jgi:phosphoribosyl 1,2-cyclic phosphodiesterase